MLLGISNIDLPTHIDPLIKNIGSRQVKNFQRSFSKRECKHKDYVATLVTFKKHSYHHNLMLILFALSSVEHIFSAHFFLY